ncbi:GNAT family N-acetyltransferase [Flavobacterium sp.]|uniref:GNAT family N-acetyltransferase n=1 Tax=Flavobacterium sp. TaxID=239 RepID=UPI0038FD341C
MITITIATPKDFETIESIARQTWLSTYGEILSKAQIEYMLQAMYSNPVLNDNYLNKNHRFLLLNEFENSIGFASYEHHYLDTNSTRLHKLYLFPENQGKGLGKLLLDRILALAKENRSEKISLNVNRFNKAYLFYQKMGFEIVAEENLFIGNGYFMEDYKMEFKLMIQIKN